LGFVKIHEFSFLIIVFEFSICVTRTSPEMSAGCTDFFRQGRNNRLTRSLSFNSGYAGRPTWHANQ